MAKLTKEESKKRYEAAWEDFEYWKKSRRERGLPELPQDEMPMVELLAEVMPPIGIHRQLNGLRREN